MKKKYSAPKIRKIGKINKITLQPGSAPAGKKSAGTDSFTRRGGNKFF